MENNLSSRRYAVAVPVAACLLGLAALTAPGAAQAATASARGGPARGAVSAARPGAVAKPATLPSGAVAECGRPTGFLQAQCQSIHLAHGVKKASSKAVGATPADASETLTASDLQSAYGISGTGGAAATKGTGETVAIVDAFGDPSIASDLATYRSNNGLSACDSSTGAGCLSVYDENGGTSLPAAPTGNNLGWEDETALDTEMVSAICPNCHIDLFEANSISVFDLGTAENTAAAKDKFVSNSWNLGPFGDFPGESAYDSYFNHPGDAITFASGDSGYGTNGWEAEYPASSQFVTSVGGTYLTGGGANPWVQYVWKDSNGGTGSGCATGVGKPAWQADTGCTNRTENDVAGVADSPQGIYVYSSDSGGAEAVGGTSAATPVIAAMYALAGTPAANTYPSSYLYQNPQDLTHVTAAAPAGTEATGAVSANGTCESSRAYLCSVTSSLSSGYNGPTGFGAPNGNLAPFTESASGNVVSLANPGHYDLQRGVNVKLPPLQAMDSAAGQTITYSASGLPAGLSIDSSSGAISGSVTYVENDTVHVTAKDSTGASATVAYRIEASDSMTADYHWAGIGHAQVDVSNKCMDDAGNSSSNGTKIQIWTCTSGDAAQNWLFQPQTAPGDYTNYGMSQLGTVRIHAKCLDIKSNGTANGSLVDLWSCTGGANQQWELTGAFGELYNPQSGKCLEDPGFSTTNGRQLDIWTCNGGNNQNWLLPASPFESAISNMCINDAGNSSANGARIISYTCNSGSNEKLRVASLSNGTTALVFNGKCLNDKGNASVNGTPVVLYTCTDSSGGVAQGNWWFLTAYGQIENAQSEKCLAIPNNSTANGTSLALEDCAGQPGEVWATS